VNAEGKGLDVTGSGNRQEEDRKGTTVEVSKRNLRRCPKPRACNYCGTNSDDTCLRVEWHPAREVAWACHEADERNVGTWDL